MKNSMVHTNRKGMIASVQAFRSCAQYHNYVILYMFVLCSGIFHIDKEYACLLANFGIVMGEFLSKKKKKKKEKKLV